MHFSFHRLFVPCLLLTLAFFITACGDALLTEPQGAEEEGAEENLRAAASANAQFESADFDGIIRVGIAPSVETGSIGASGSFTVEPRDGGDPLFTSSGGTVEVELDSEGLTETRFRLQAFFTTSSDFKEDWLEQAEEEGYETYVEDHPTLDGWRLLIGSFPLDAGWLERSAFRQEVIDAGLAGDDSFWREITESEGESTIVLRHDGEEYQSAEPVALQADDLVKIEGDSYRGAAEVVFTESGVLSVVNALELNEYLYGVVPRELPPEVGDWGELEAQKAQAVTARTFALSRIGSRSDEGFDVLPTSTDQVYGGVDAEHSRSSEAVDETAGLIATHDGSLISTVYHSTSGGYTASNEDIWGTEPVAYLRGVPDAERGRALEKNPNPQVFRNASNARNLRGFRGGDYEADQSQYHRWYFEWTAEEISEVVSEFAGSDVGTVREINVLERSESGRVSEIEFVTDAGPFTEEKDDIRWALQFFDANGNMRPLLSTLFLIEPIREGQGPRHEREVVGFEAHGGGWGHGIGMSQTGAAGMAKRGKSFEEILTHYYRGIELVSYQGLSAE